MKILVVIPTIKSLNGVDYHRMLIPHNRLGQLYKDVEVSVCDTLTGVDDLSCYDLVVMNRFISRDHTDIETMNKLRSTKWIVDLDDDYKLPHNHILAQESKRNGNVGKIRNGINNATATIVSTQLLADTIKNELMPKRVFIIPNGIDPNQDQFKPQPTASDKLTFGWSGSITHFDDVLEMHDSLYSLYKSKEFENRFRFIYGGHAPHDQTSNAILAVLTCKGVADTNQFATYPVMDAHNYAKFYNVVDVAMIPLRDNRFNSLKSNLKMLEAGFLRKAVIVSGVEPYTSLINDGVNCLVAKSKKDWYKHMAYLINNPRRVEELSRQLYEDVQQYHIDYLTHQRYSIYNQICRNN